MRSAIFIVLLLTCCPGFAQSDTLNRLDSLGKRQGYWIITGSMKKDARFAPGAKAEEGRYVDGKKTGPWIEYYPNGNKRSELVYSANRPNGTAVMYTESGSVLEKGTWSGTRWTGEYRMYYENDTIVRQHFFFNAMGQREGMQYTYHPNGMPAESCNFKAGKEEGWKKQYDTTGRLYRERWYNAGIEDPGKLKTYPPLPESAARDVGRYYPPSYRHEKPGPALAGRELPPACNDCDVQYTLLNKDGQVSKKGVFRNRALYDGQEYVYNDKGMLVQIKVYKKGQYTGDAPLPD